jgi:hypothetical protein
MPSACRDQVNLQAHQFAFIQFGKHRPGDLDGSACLGVTRHAWGSDVTEVAYGMRVFASLNYANATAKTADSGSKPTLGDTYIDQVWMTVVTASDAVDSLVFGDQPLTVTGFEKRMPVRPGQLAPVWIPRIILADVSGGHPNLL